MDTFQPWQPRIRKDPFGVQGYYRLAIERYRWVERYFSFEHVEVADPVVGSIGEHNTREIPREVGSIYVVGGPAYSIEGFRYAASATRSSLGTLTLDLDPLPYATTDDMSVVVQSCSERWATKPASTTHVIGSTSSIGFYSQYLSSALGTTPATWTAEDADFCVAIHGPTLGSGGWLPVSQVHVRGGYIDDTNGDMNATIQADVDLRAAFLVEHDAAGDHASREVARTWAHIGVHAGGGTYDILGGSSRNGCISATRVAAGQCELTFDNAFTLSAQPFVQTDYQRLNSGDEGDIYVSGCPRTQIFTDAGNVKVYIYIYQYDPVANTWAAADTDFYIVIHGG